MASQRNPQILLLYPKNELVFKGPFTEVVTAKLKLTNPSNQSVVFWIKTTAPKQYCVRPNNGVVHAHADAHISVMLQPGDVSASDRQKHKFMVQTLMAPPDFDVEEIHRVWKTTPRSQFMDSKLTCTFIDNPFEEQLNKMPTSQTAPLVRVRHRRPPSGASLTPQKKESTLPVQPDLTSYSPWTPKKQESTLPLQQTPSSTLAQQKQESTPSLQDEPLKQGSNPFLQNEVEKAFREAKLRPLQERVEKLSSENTQLKAEGRKLKQQLAEASSQSLKTKTDEDKIRELTRELAQTKTGLERRIELAREKAVSDLTQEFEQRKAELEHRVQLAEEELKTQKAVIEHRAELAEERALKLETQKADLERRVEQANEKASAELAQEFEQTKADLERKAELARDKAMKLEAQKADLERRVELAEERAMNSETQKTDMGQGAELAKEKEEFEQTKADLERKVELAEERATKLETQWVVNREEIDMTQQTLGEGGWGTVKVAKFRGIKVAAKMLYQEIQSDYYRELFIREMNMAARIRHPNLVQFIGATIEGDMIILAELLPTNLRSTLEKGSLSKEQNNAICLDICRALNYLHLMKPEPVVHRDVSSANVLLEPLPGNLWKAKLTDYGSVNTLQQLKTQGPGNPTYSAPESNFPNKQSPKMDVFSFGILMIEMFSGKFPSVDARERLVLSIKDRPIVGLIKKCTAHNMEKRPTISEILTYFYLVCGN